jgi:hypothetical protein
MGKIVRKLVIDEISCVDKPAQKHARALIIKRMEEARDAYDVAEDLQLAAEAGLMADLDKGDIDRLIKARANDIRRPGERDASAYTRAIEHDEIGKVLLQLYKSAPKVSPSTAESDRALIRESRTQTGPSVPKPPHKAGPAPGDTPEEEAKARGKAHHEMHLLAVARNKSNPKESWAQSYARVFADGGNKDLAGRVNDEHIANARRSMNKQVS